MVTIRRTPRARRVEGTSITSPSLRSNVHADAHSQVSGASLGICSCVRRNMKTQSIPFNLVGGHVLFDLDGVTTFLDTGSQVSFGSVRSLNLMGVDYPIRSSIDGRITVANVRDGLKKYAQVPKDFDFQAVLGVDILAGSTVKLDWKRERMTVNRNSVSNVVLLTAALPLIPRGTLMVGRKSVSAILDTGAWTSYLHPDLAVGLREVGRFRDYNPMLGGFSTGLVRAPLRFKGWSGKISVGVATPRLAKMLDAMNVLAIVGNDILATTIALTMEIVPEWREPPR